MGEGSCGLAHFKTVYQHLSGETDKNNEKPVTC